MSATKTTVGRRVDSFDAIERGGDYLLTTVLDHGEERPAIYFLLPTHVGDKFDHSQPQNGIHMITSPPWTFRECLDGSIEARASIACGRGGPHGEYWHGFLDEGNVWREV